MQQDDIQNEIENKKSSKKDVWLFFIFIDIIALCVLGFFIYTSFFDGLNVTVKSDNIPAPFVEEVKVEDLKTDIKPAVKENAPQPVVEEKAKPAPVKEEASASAPKESKEEKPSALPAAKKQSVFVSGSGKTRTVTFKYFGNAKKAAVVGGFTMRKPVAMKKVGDEWRVSLIIYPGEYRYLYVIDGKEIPDPNADEEGGRSVLVVK